MSATIFASFDNGPHAKQAIAVLVSSGQPADDVTLACKSATPQPEPQDQEFGGMAGTFPDLRPTGPGTGVAGSANRIADIAATSNAASNPGQMSDYLWESLPTDLARYYQQQFEGGRGIVIVRHPIDTAADLLREQGAINVKKQGFLA